MRRRLSRFHPRHPALAVVLFIGGSCLIACAESHAAEPRDQGGGSGRDAMVLPDVGGPQDAGPTEDGAVPLDLDVPDIATMDDGVPDSGPLDMGSPMDSGPTDMGAPVDMGPQCSASADRPFIIPPEPPCRTDSECFDGRSCAHPDIPACGGAQIIECQTSISCPSRFVCEGDGCGSRFCVQDCREFGCSQFGESCDDSTGLCRFDACERGATCALDRVCDPDARDVDATGCSAAACADDAGCACGPCVSGRCATGLGTCQFPRP